MLHHAFCELVCAALHQLAKSLIITSDVHSIPVLLPHALLSTLYALGDALEQTASIAISRSFACGHGSARLGGDHVPNARQSAPMVFRGDGRYARRPCTNLDSFLPRGIYSGCSSALPPVPCHRNQQRSFAGTSGQVLFSKTLLGRLPTTSDYQKISFAAGQCMGVAESPFHFSQAQ